MRKTLTEESPENNRKGKSKKLKKHITVMGIVGIFLSAMGLMQIGYLEAFVMMGVLPMFCIIAFMVKKCQCLVLPIP